ncbi:hypothetical protein MKW94_030797 [Papaver nudicaule]|uniref:TF-B3 domain-containing protein n=1 Tax=Papaver nudicaule TaxID=74823 RepID=A0AA41VKG2_PAPNU|nr:hypothetical protein [Papaver nudicaule]
MKKAEGVILFEKCWPEFMDFYSICVGHLIVFRYDGNSNFQVHIFGMDATEIDYYPSHMDNAKQEVEVVSSYSDEVEVVLPSKKRRIVEVVSVHSDSTQSITEPSMSSVSTPQSNYEPFMSSESTTQSNYTPSVSTRQEHPRKYPKQNTVIPVRLYNTAFRETLEAADAFRSENPFFKVVLQTSHVKKAVRVPIAFARSYLKNITQRITLRILDGRTWEVRYIAGRRLSHGWYNKFVADNHLKEGDVCVFELVDRIKFEMNVHIFQQQKTFGSKLNHISSYYTSEFQATLEAAELFTSENPFFKVVMPHAYIGGSGMVRVPAGFATSHFTNITQTVITLRVSDGRTWEVGYVFQAPSERRISKGWRRFVAENDLKEGDVCVFELVDRKKIEMIVHIFGQQKTFASKLTPKIRFYTAEFQAALEAAEEFTSENPFFMVVMQAIHIKRGMLWVPAVFATSYLANLTRMVITLRISRNKTWEVGYVSRTPTQRWISQGWRKFVVDNDLKEGDICIFELVERKKLQMNVHIFHCLQDTV